MIEEKAKELDILLSEHRRLCEDIQRIFGRIEKIAGFWMIIMSSIFAVALKEKLQELLLILPSLFLSIFFYLINMLEFVMMTGGHAAALEVRINKMVGASVLRWESQLTKTLTHNKLSTIIALGLSVIISIGVMFASIYMTRANHSILSLINILIIILSLPFIIYLLKKLSTIHKDVQDIVMNLDIIN